jgi:hypothetical protein
MNGPDLRTTKSNPKNCPKVMIVKNEYCSSHDTVTCQVDNLTDQYKTLHADLNHLKWLVGILIVQAMGIGVISL